MNTCFSTIKHAVSIAMLVGGCAIVFGCGDRKSNTDYERNDPIASEKQRMDEQQPDTNTGMNAAPGQTFAATLTGSEEVPSVETTARGNITLAIRGDSIYAEGQFSGLGSAYSASHIHIGAEGENGKPIVTLDPEIGPDSTSGSWDDSYKLDQSQLSALKAGSLYVNVHSRNHESGEIRGQLTSSARSDSVIGSKL